MVTAGFAFPEPPGTKTARILPFFLRKKRRPIVQPPRISFTEGHLPNSSAMVAKPFMTVEPVSLLRDSVS